MKAVVNVQNLLTEEDKKVILRNLSRIMDIRVIDIDVENRTLQFLYVHQLVLNKVREEMVRLGYPIQTDSSDTYLPRIFNNDAMRSANY
ncbi:hypothetical protein [Maribacter polysaccharolyticus]|uniref:hypothetical protein n=1 Tax=Maribacter polysaccharolyticus TaxID=3020831 RepID=UPI00237F538A|nr:hypothetical protein [Maribacter polysaccharolyticus]MDE3742558.1 hypothetical protein [Maribacter polysaccharolyticus]